MRNQRALAAACAAVAMLGFAAPVAVADGMGNGGGPAGGTGTGGIAVPGTGGIGTVPGGGGGVVVGGIGGGNFNGNFNGNGIFNCNGNFGNGNFNGNNFNGNCRGNDNFGRGDNGRGNDNFGRGNDNFGRGDNDFGRGGNFGDRGEGHIRNIIVTPNVVAAGGHITITVEGCRGGTVSSRAFRTITLRPLADDSSRGEARIDNDVRPGRYDITVNCDGRSVTRTWAFTVLGGVQGGLGGSSSTGATPTDMAIGGGLVASAVFGGGGAFLLRRRGERRI